MPTPTRLSVNLNKVALLRNSRRTGVPDVLRFAELAHEARADGITVHPRPDERHIRRTDVFELAQRTRPWRPRFELNLEGYPDDRLFDIVRIVRPEQCTLVPDRPDTFTSEEGWKLSAAELPWVKRAVSTAKQCGSRVILFVDPNPDVVSSVATTGADGIEIYTGSYASAMRTGIHRAQLNDIVETAQRAAALGLAINIGHDLNLRNLQPLMAALPAVAEASIGHELTADALVMGFKPAVMAYKAALTTHDTDKLSVNSGPPTALTPILSTARLVLRPLALEDVAAIQQLFPHWEVVRWLHATVPWPFPANGAETNVRECLEKCARGERFDWAICLKERPDQLIGRINLRPDDGARDQRGFWLGQDYWGQGLMTEAARAVTEYAFNDLGWSYLWLTNAEGNLASHRVKEKQGARIVDRVPRRFVSGDGIAEIWWLGRDK